MLPTTQTNALAQLKGRIARKWKTDSSVASIFRNMTVLASGTVAARAIGVLTVPVITRLYLPEHFGVLSVFAAITALLMPFGTLRYSMAIPLPKQDGMAINLAVLCGICLLICWSQRPGPIKHTVDFGSIGVCIVNGKESGYVQNWDLQPVLGRKRIGTPHGWRR